MLLPAHPCLPLSLPTFSGLPLSRPVAASASLSDPRCFRSLSVASVLDSDYSASVSSFPFSSRFRLTVASSVLRSHFRSFGFPRSFLPGFPCISSRFRYLASLYVSFRSSLIRSHSRSSGAYLPLSLPVFSVPPPLPFVRFLLPFQLLSLLLLPFCPLDLRLTVGSLSRLGSLRPLRLSPSSTAGFPSVSSGSAYSAFCSFPFVLPCFAPTAVPQVLPFWISPPGSVPDFHFLSSASIVASHYSASVFPFHSLPVSASQLASSVLLFRSRFPDLSPYSRPGFPCLLSGSVYLASCSFPFVLPSFAPTAVPLVLPFWISPRGSTLDFRFLSSSSALASHYSASVSSFPLFPFPLTVGLTGARPFLSSLSLSPSAPPVSMLPFRFWYSAFLLFLSPLPLLRVTGATSAAGLLFPARPSPLAFALGSGYLACPF